MKQIILHIGNYKTGSTSIQNAIHANRNRLIDRGIYVPSAGFAEGAHHNWARSWLKRPMAPPAEKLFDEIKHELSQTKCDRILVSSEVFFTGEFASDVIASLQDYDFRVICYLRRPDAFYSAFYQQLVKHPYFRETKPPSLELLRSCRATQYLKCLSSWADAVGDGKVEVYPFDKNSLEGDLLAHFFTLIGVDDPSDYKQGGADDAVNVTIHNELLEYLRASNAFAHNREEHMALMRMLNHIASLDGANAALNRKNVFSPQDRRAILADTKAELTEISKRFARLPSETQSLFQNMDVDEDPDWKESYLDEVALARITSAIWIKQQAHTISVLNKISYAKGNIVSYLMSAEQRLRSKLKKDT